jgi:hypothetical protein
LLANALVTAVEKEPDNKKEYIGTDNTYYDDDDDAPAIEREADEVALYDALLEYQSAYRYDPRWTYSHLPLEPSSRMG